MSQKNGKKSSDGLKELMEMDRSTEKVQVCLPVYNGSMYVRDTLLTLLNQTHSNLEILVLDDASTDDTYEILNQLAEQDARIIVYRNEKNLGIVGSRNRLFSLCNARYIAIADSDDLHERSRIEEQINFLKENDLALVSCAYRAFGDRSFVFFPPEIHDEIEASMLLYNVILNPGVLIDCAKVKSEDLLVFEEYLGAEDYDCWLRLSKVYKIGCVKKILVNYRIHQEQESSENFIRQQNVHLKILENEYAFLNFEYNYEMLKLIIWPHLYGNGLDLSELKLLGGYVNKLISDIGESDLVSKDFFIFNLDIRFRGISRRYGVKGFILYMRYRGLKALVKGNKFGFSFFYDCFFRG